MPVGYNSASIKQHLMCRGNNLYIENVYFTYVSYDLNEKQQQQMQGSVVLQTPTAQPGQPQLEKREAVKTSVSAGSCAVAFLTLQPCWLTGFCLS